jgi:hypothetical protein
MAEALIFDYSAASNASAARAYYDEYSEKYREQRAAATTAAPSEFRREGGPASGRRAGPAAAALEKYRQYAADWKYSYGCLVQAAELAGEPVASLETIGATEGREYPDVLAGAGAPPPPQTKDDQRLLAADSAVRVFLAAYNRLRFVSRFPQPPPAAASLLEEAGVPQHLYGSLPSELPDVYDDYHPKRLALLQLRPPAEVLLFSIESLARKALALAAAGKEAGKPAWVGRLGELFARKELREVLRSERLLAKNPPFDMNIFGGEDIGGGALGAADDMLPADDFGGAGEDVLDSIAASSGEDGAEDPFSLEAVDIGPNSPNLEPD